MKSKTGIAVLIIAMVAIFSSPVKSAGFFTDRGSIWTGGTFSFSSQTYYHGQTVNVFMLSPAFRYFAAKYFLVGPAFAWRDISNSNYGDRYSTGSLYLGPELGFAYGNHRVIPYAISGVQYTHSYSSDYYSSDGFQIPINGGIMVALFDGIGIQFEMGITFNHSRSTLGLNPDATMFSLCLGVCGIVGKTAISLLSSFRGLLY